MSHPLHPALVHFPVAAWSLATAADVAAGWVDAPMWRFAGWLHVVGTAMALPAMAAGLAQFARLPEGDSAAKPAVRHMVLAMLAWSAYAAALALRWQDAAIVAPGGMAIAASLVGFVLLCAAGWQGGQLVYRHGVGVETVARPALQPGRARTERSQSR
jgi:uncharacterized membrane protein